jgi:hypothetical protein
MKSTFSSEQRGELSDREYRGVCYKLESFFLKELTHAKEVCDKKGEYLHSNR